MTKSTFTKLVTTIMTFAYVLPTAIFADGQPTTPYSPYGHNPVDTAIGGVENIVIITAVVTYVLGLILIVYARKLKEILNTNR